MTRIPGIDGRLEGRWYASRERSPARVLQVRAGHPSSRTVSQLLAKRQSRSTVGTETSRA